MLPCGMLVFVDESGDSGLKLTQGSTAFFTVVLVVFTDSVAAETANNAIKACREKLKLNGEFHFAKLSNDFRTRFFESVASCPFEYYGIVINKAKLRGPGFHFKESFYKYACRMVMSNAKSILKRATVIIDGSGDRKFKRELQYYFRKHLNDPDHPDRLLKVQMHDSHRDDLVQLADMVSGAVARSFSDKPDAGAFRRLIRKREKYVQFWPQ
jgi:hypothetical protein